jgi:hypothetical protein
MKSLRTRNRKSSVDGKLFIKPARESVESILAKVKQIVRELLGRAAHLLISRLNPIIRGWANYHRHVVCKRSSPESMLRYSGCYGTGRKPVIPKRGWLD